MVLNQMPQLGATLQVGGDHGCPGAETVRATGRPQHTLWNGRLVRVVEVCSAYGKTQGYFYVCLFSINKGTLLQNVTSLKQQPQNSA